MKGTATRIALFAATTALFSACTAAPSALSIGTASPPQVTFVTPSPSASPSSSATPASTSAAIGVTPTVLARGTYDSFSVASESAGAVDFRAATRARLDIVVRRHEYAPGATTGWHSHPAPVFITVIEGQLTYYEYDDPSCAPHVVSKGQGFVDSGHGHVVRNLTDQPATDVSVIIAPVGGAFRGELAAPGPHCKF